jgi:hypothetical protein
VAGVRAQAGLTAKGLPQRVRNSTGLGGPQALGPRPVRGAGPVLDAEGLRRQLGGLQRGLRAGRRDAEREITQGDAGGPAATVEEATR